MKFSLRTLMIVVTVACLVLGAMARRIDYLSRKASFHDRQYAVSLDRLANITNQRADEMQDLMEVLAQTDPTDVDDQIEKVKIFFFNPTPPSPRRISYKEYAKNRDKFASEWRAACNHRRLAEAYRHAIRHPFEFVDESSSPQTHR